MTVFLTAIAAVSISLNIYAFFFNKKPQKQALSVDAKQLLHDLTHGGAIVKVTVIDPEGLLIYRGAKS